MSQFNTYQYLIIGQLAQTASIKAQRFMGAFSDAVCSKTLDNVRFY
jgi:hypothetical protein